jgi:hypothetical protein
MQPESALDNRSHRALRNAGDECGPLRAASKLRRRRRKSVQEERQRQNIKLQATAFYFLLGATAIILASVLLILFLQGFALDGFNLPVKLLYVLITGTILEVAGAFYFIVGVLFGKRVEGGQARQTGGQQ